MRYVAQIYQDTEASKNNLNRMQTKLKTCLDMDPAALEQDDQVMTVVDECIAHMKPIKSQLVTRKVLVNKFDKSASSTDVP